jgi:hypothetical protein
MTSSPVNFKDPDQRLADTSMGNNTRLGVGHGYDGKLAADALAIRSAPGRRRRRRLLAVKGKIGLRTATLRGRCVIKTVQTARCGTK